MKITTRGEYGLRALMELGIEPDKGLSLRDIAQRQHISLDYLEQIVPALKNAGLIKSKRGAQGGYLLAKPPEEITVFDALVALEGSLDPVQCLSGEEATMCLASGNCAVQGVWVEMKNAVEAVVKQITLEELLQRQRQKFGGPIRTYSEHEILKLPVLN